MFLDSLRVSLDACYRWLEKPRSARRVVFSLLVIHSGLLAYNAYVHSPTLNEPGHLVAGVSHWKYGRFELYRVNPPLVRMVAALPVTAVGYEEDWSKYFEGPGARPVFRMGEDFVAANGEHSFFLFMIARWACIPFSWIGMIACYLWARDLYGRPSGVMACTLWCFSPNILAHASLITADVGGTALGVAACYTFWRWLKQPTWLQAALTGVVLGLAELAKTTLILFYPLWPVLWVVYRWRARHAMRLGDWTREAGMLVLRMVIGIYVLNLGYGFEGSFKPLKEFHFVSDLFTSRESRDENQGQDSRQSTVGSGQSNSLARSSEPHTVSHNRFANTPLENVPLPLPKNYILGIDIQQKDFEDYGQPSYLRGKFQDKGWWYYYLYALTIKVPLGTWLLATIAVLACGKLSKSTCAWTDQLVLLAPPMIILIIVSSKTGFNHHMRYTLPCFPFIFVRISQTAVLFRCLGRLTNNMQTERSVGHLRVDRLFGPLITIVALLWSISSSLSIYPHNLSYFNELVGGPRGGANHLLHSNIDWGQDLCYLARWIEANQDMLENEPLYLAYFGYCNPADIGFDETLPWPLKATDSSSEPQHQASLAFFAISTNHLYGFPWKVRDGATGDGSIDKSLVDEFLNSEPIARAGYSISIYRRD